MEHCRLPETSSNTEDGWGKYPIATETAGRYAYLNVPIANTIWSQTTGDISGRTFILDLQHSPPQFGENPFYILALEV